MIKSIKIGAHNFPINLIQGPLAGYSNAPFRLLTRKYGKPAFSCTEMISANALVKQPTLTRRRYALKEDQEGPVCFQLSGNDPNILAQAAKIVTDYGADIIDLNCGCPVDKIRRKGHGSSLLSKPSQLFDLITALKNNTHVPVSIKIRVDSQSGNNFNQSIVGVIQDAGVDFLVVHGRHWTERYETPCNYEEIKFFVDSLNIPVIGNGDVSCSNSLKKMFATGCAGVMIARAGVGQPWLIQKLLAEQNQELFSPPSSQEVGEIYWQHLFSLRKLFDNEKIIVLHARKLIKYYAREIKEKTQLITAVQQCNSLTELQKLILEYFKN